MNIKIITLHSLYNPGSNLQAFALQKYLSKDNEVQIIDYRPAYTRYGNSLLRSLIRKLLFFRSRMRETKKIHDFMKKYMNLTKTYYTYESLSKDNLKADLFVVGSDQLWNTDFPCGNDNAFYLDFIKNTKKITYSTSVGKKIIDKKNLEKIRKFKDDFLSIAVREKDTSVQLTKKLGKKISWVCDPVFLLEASVYDAMINQKSRFDRPYVLVYLIQKNQLLDELVKYFRSKGLLIVMGGGYNKNRCLCDVHIKDMGPLDFLNLIKYAKIVVSASFHATAFCHIFHKEFLTILPQKNGERIVSLLEQTELTNRILIDSVNYDNIEKKIDWENVDKKLSEYIINSKVYLKHAIIQ